MLGQLLAHSLGLQTVFTLRTSRSPAGSGWQRRKTPWLGRKRGESTTATWAKYVGLVGWDEDKVCVDGWAGVGERVGGVGVGWGWELHQDNVVLPRDQDERDAATEHE